MYSPGAAHHSHPLADTSSSIVLSLVDEFGNATLYQVSPLVRVGDVLAYHFGKRGYIAHANSFCRHPLAVASPNHTSPATNVLPHLLPVMVDSHATHSLAACSRYALVVNCNENSACLRCGSGTGTCGCSAPTLCSLTSGCGLCMGQGFVLKYRGCHVPLHALVGEAWGPEAYNMWNDKGSDEYELDSDGAIVTRQCYIECDYSWMYLRLASVWDEEHSKWSDAQRAWSAQWHAVLKEREDRDQEKLEKEREMLVIQEREKQARTDWEKERRNFEAEKVSLTHQIEKITAEKEAREKDIATLRDRLRRAELSAGEASGRDKKKVEKHASQLKERVDEQNRLLTQHKQKEEEYKLRLSTLERRVAESESVRDAAEKELVKLRAKATRVDNLQERLDKALDAEAENGQLKLKLTQITRERDDLLKKTKEREKEKEKEKEKKRSSREQERDLVALRYRIQHLEHESSEWKYRYTNLANNLESSIYHAKMSREASKDDKPRDGEQKDVRPAPTGPHSAASDDRHTTRQNSSISTTSSASIPGVDIGAEQPDTEQAKDYLVGVERYLNMSAPRDTVIPHTSSTSSTATSSTAVAPKDAFHRYRDAREYVPTLPTNNLSNPNSQHGSAQASAGAPAKDARGGPVSPLAEHTSISNGPNGALGMHSRTAAGNSIGASGSSLVNGSMPPPLGNAQSFPSGLVYGSPLHPMSNGTPHGGMQASGNGLAPGSVSNPALGGAMLDSLLNINFHKPYHAGTGPSGVNSTFPANSLGNMGATLPNMTGSLGTGMNHRTPFETFPYNDYLDMPAPAPTHMPDTHRIPSSSTGIPSTDPSHSFPPSSTHGLPSFSYSYLPQQASHFPQPYMPANGSTTAYAPMGPGGASAGGLASGSVPGMRPGMGNAMANGMGNGMGLFGWDPFPKSLSGSGFSGMNDTAGVGMGMAWGSLPLDGNDRNSGNFDGTGHKKDAGSDGKIDADGGME